MRVLQLVYKPYPSMTDKKAKQVLVAVTHSGSTWFKSWT